MSLEPQKPYPRYYSDQGGRVQLKRIDEHTHSMVGILKGKNFERFLDLRSNSCAIQMQFWEASFEVSTEENYINLLRQYCDEIEQIKINLQQILNPQNL